MKRRPLKEVRGDGSTVKRRRKKIEGEGGEVDGRAEIVSLLTDDGSDILKDMEKEKKDGKEERDVPMTETEKRREATLKVREEDACQKQAKKSYRENIQAYNEYLAKIPEHHDLPRVGPG
jgi:protein FAM32A